MVYLCEELKQLFFFFFSGQVVNILREASARPPHYLFRRNFTSHISIPASYCSGILLTVPKDSPAATQLKNAPELPFKNS